MLRIIIPTLFFLLFATSFYLCGRFFLKKNIREGLSFLERFVFCSALGLGVISWFFYAVGALGLLYQIAIYGIIALPFLTIFHERLALRSAYKEILEIFRSRLAWLFLGISFFIFLMSLSPLVGGDALCYHLHLAKEFGFRHQISSIPYDINSDWPFLFESLYSAAHLLGGAALAKTFHFYSAFLIALSLVAFLRREERGGLVFVPALVYLLAPLIANLSATAYVDIGFSLFTWFSLLAGLYWLYSRQTVWVILSGFYIGCAFSIKFLAVFALMALVAAFFWEIIKNPDHRKHFLRNISLFVAVALVAGAYWYIKLWKQYGNPVYPYFDSFFGGVGDPLAHHPNALPKNILGVILSPFYITFLPQLLSGFSEQPGPLFFFFAPFSFLAFRRQEIRILWVYVLVYLGLWVSFYQNLRFLTPLIPGLSLLFWYGWGGLSRKGELWKKLTGGVVALALTAQTLLLGYHYREEMKFTLGMVSEKQYLTKKDRVYGIAQYMNQAWGRRAKIFMPNEIFFYRFDAETVRGNYMMKENPLIFDGAHLVEALRFMKEQNITHILIADQKSARNQVFLASILSIAQERLPDSGLVLERIEKGGEGHTYILYRLN